MEEYTYDEVWIELIKFVLELHKQPKYKPKTVKDAQNLLNFVPSIRNIIRTLDNMDKYLEMVIMTDEFEDLLQKELNELQNQKYG